jgi:hypothetical protein
MSFNNIPNVPHWAIVKSVNVFIPGDERSRTNPGHGYPEHTEEYITYTAFIDEAEWLREIENLSMSHWPKPFRAFKVEPVIVTTKVEVKVK